MPVQKSLIWISHLGLSVALLSACGGSGEATPVFEPIQVTVAHINDHHSQLEPFADTELTLDGVPTRVDLGGAARISSAFQRYANRQDVIKLHAGDAMTGSLYYTLFKGEADAAMMNTVCFDAFALGNHEFDDGDSGLKQFLDHLRSGTCKTPALAANVKPAAGTPIAGLIEPHTIKTINGVKVAIIGIDVKGKTTNSSRPLGSTIFEDEVTAAQREIDALKSQGIRHFIVLTHQGYEADKAMAARLSDVDVIVGGDSHSLLGEFSTVGLSSAGDYPTLLTNKDGKPVCVVQAWEYNKAIGELNIAFNNKGEVDSCNGQASLLVGSSFKRQVNNTWQLVDDSTRLQIIQSLQNVPNVRVTEPDTVAALTLASYSSQVTAKKAETIGIASEALCLMRVPGGNNRSAGVAGCENANTLARGSDVAQVVADAFLAGSLRADVAIQNAGGVRMAVPAGTLSMNTAFTLLPFTNVLIEMPMTGQQLVSVLEDAVANHLDNSGSDGSHPYAAALRWNLDMSQARGQRFTQVQVRDRSTGNWAAIDLERTYTVVTNDFIASGRDGYTTFGSVYATGNYVNNYLLYTQTFVDYVKARNTVGRPAAADYSHQQVTTRDGTLLPQGR